MKSFSVRNVPWH